MTRSSAELISHVNAAIHAAHEFKSKLDEETLAIGGFSTPLMRHLFCNLMGDPVKRYLEVGCWKGASLCAAAVGGAECIGIEDFSQDFGSPNVRETLLKNVFRGAVDLQLSVELVEKDYRTMTPEDGFGVFDCVMYDGEHSYESQRAALTNLEPFMADLCIYICDDFSWPDVTRGTLDGFSDIAKRRKVVKEWVWHVIGRNDDPLYHNGLGIFLTEKYELSRNKQTP